MYLIRTSQQPDESDSGYRVRLLEANGYKRPWSILREDEALRRHSMAGQADGSTTVGETRRRCAADRRYCPLCLAEREVWLRDWETKAIAACGLHGALLEASCPQCGSALSWGRARLTRCAVCDALLAERPARPANACSSSVARLLGGQMVPGFQLFSTGDIPWLALAFVFFGTDPASDRWRAEQVGAWSETQRLEYNARAYDVLVDWPINFFAWLDARRRTVPDLKQLNGFGSWLYRLRSTLGKNDKLWAACHEYFQSIWTGLPVKTFSVFFPGKPETQQRMVAQEAGRYLGVTSKTIKLMVQDGRLPGTFERCGRRTFVVVTRAALDAYKTDPLRRLSLAEVADYLEISHSQTKTLIGNNVLGTRRTGGVTSVDQTTLDDLLRRLAATASVPELGKSLTPLDRLPRRRGVFLSDAVTRILSGTLPCFRVPGTTGQDFTSFAVDISDVLGYRHGREGDVFCSAARSAKILKMSQRMVGVLVDRGCLDGLRTGNQIAVRSITMRSLVAFKTDYVGATELAEAWRTNTRTVFARLRKAGLQQIIESDIQRGISAVWLRSHVDAADISRGPTGRLNNRSWRRRGMERKTLRCVADQLAL